MKDHKIKGKKFLVTGGAGFVGSHMCDLLLSKGGKVVCIDNLSTGSINNIKYLANNPEFKFFKVDVNKLKPLEKVFKKFRPDYVLHYAAVVGVNRTSKYPLEVLNDIEGIRTIAELSLKYKVKKILFASSSEVYGEPIKLPIGEGDFFNARWPYSLVKIFGEQYFQSYYEKYKLPVTILRFFNAYGPRQNFGDSGFVVPVFLKRALSGQSIEVFGSGKQTRDFVYIDDNVRLSLKAFCDSRVDGRPMNIGSGNSISILELAELVTELVGRSPIVFKPLRKKGEINYRHPDISFMKKMLRDEPKIKLKEGLLKTIESLKNGKRFL